MSGGYYKSVTGRCAVCSRYREEKCPGMHDYFYWKECPIYREDIRRGFNGNDKQKGYENSRKGKAHK
jgi:hypothetical protein